MLTVDEFAPAVIEREIERLLAKKGERIATMRRPYFCFNVPTPETLPNEPLLAETVAVDGRSLPVLYCPTPIGIRYALREYTSGAVILTSLEQDVLHDEITERLYQKKIRHIDRWRQVEHLFGVERRELMLNRWTELPEWLIEVAKSGEITRIAGGVLSERRAWDALLRSIFGVDQPIENELRLILNVENATVRRSLIELRSERQRQLTKALKRFGMSDLAYVLRILWTSSTVSRGDLSPLGAVLVVDELNRVAANGAGGSNLPISVLTRIGKLDLDGLIGEKAESVASAAQMLRTVFSNPTSLAAERQEKLAQKLLASAELVYEQLGNVSITEMSELTRSGWERRLTELAEAVTASVARETEFEPVRSAWVRLASHEYGQAFESKHSLRHAEHLVQLTAALASFEAPSLTNVVDDWIRSGSYANRLLEALAQVTMTTQLRGAYLEIRDAWDRRNRALDEAVARHAVMYVEQQKTLHGAIPMHRFGTEIVEPVLDYAGSAGAMVIVLDGMSWSAAHELFESPELSRWTMFAPGSHEALRCLQAPVPTVTRLARYSLLSGELRADGDQASERKAFESRFKNAKLYFKNDLKRDSIEEVLDRVEDSKTKLVGVVVNAIDDSLSSSSQLDVQLRVELIAVLRDLLQTARSRGRIVILTADHGHIRPVETPSAGSNGVGGERFRVGDDAAVDGEVVTEHAVFAPLGGKRLRVAWSPKLHYSHPARGYHGGAHRAELLAPVLALVPDEMTFIDEGWISVGFAHGERPEWWNRHLVEMSDQHSSPVEQVRSAEPSRARGKKRTAEGQGRLFASAPEPNDDEGSSEPSSAWTKLLATSSIRQRLASQSHIQRLEPPQLEQFNEVLRASEGRIPARLLINRINGLSARKESRLRSALRDTFNQEMKDAARIDEQDCLVVNVERLAQFYGIGR